MKHDNTLRCTRRLKEYHRNPYLCSPGLKKSTTFRSLLFLTFLFSLCFLPQLASAQSCTNRTATNTIHCNSGIVYSIWLHNGTSGYHFSGNESNYTWQECNDGTAEFTASGLTNPNAAGEVISVHLTFSGATTTPPSGSPKNNICASTNTNGWVYYEQTGGTISSNVHGNMTVDRRGPAFQLGNNANQTGVGFGASGWFDVYGGDHYWEKGDINIMLSNGDEVCDGQINSLVLDDLNGGADFALANGGTYNVGELPSSFRLEALVSGTHESLKFQISGDLNVNHTENYLPYTYPGGSSAALTLGPGSYTVSAMLYSGNNLSGDICDTKTVHFTIVENVCTGTITGLILDNLSGGADFALANGGSYTTDELPSSFRLEALVSGNHESLGWTISGDLHVSHTENYIPYTYPGGSNSALNLGPGTYTVNAKLYTENHLHGTLCDEKTITFTIVNPPCTGQITGLIFDNLGGGADVSISNGATFTVDQLPSSFRLEALVSGDHESLGWTISGDLNVNHTENYLPYTYPGGSNSALNLGIGTYTVNAKLFTENHLGGAICDEITVTFSIIPTPCTGQITSVVINDLGGGADIVLSNGASFTVGQLPVSFNIEALTSGDVESVRFTISGDLTDAHTENYAPYRYKGDNNQLNIGVGNYTINVKAFQENHASGPLCDETTVSFSIVDEICENITYGGTIGLGSGGFFNEEETCNPCAVPIIQSNAAPSGGSGNLEIAWIKRPMSTNLQECQDAFSEMASLNVGQLYDDWLAAGADPNNAQIGNTSWMFITDGDNDDLTLTLGCLEESTCFVRCARREGCTPFSGETNFVRIEVNVPLNGGTIAVTPPQGGDPYLGGAAICLGDPIPVIGTSIFDNTFTGVGPNGELLEFVWLQTSNAADPAGAFSELAGLNVGMLYNNFVANGMTDPNIYGTSWKFATDNDGDDLKLSLSSLTASAAFVRCARVVGDTRFCGESSFASITVEDCAPVAPSCTYERCNGVATITGTSNSAINLVKILDADVAGLPAVFECGTFLGQQCDDPIVFNLPNPNGNYIVTIVCDDGNHYEYLVENCGGSLVEQGNGSNTAQNNRAVSNDDSESNSEPAQSRDLFNNAGLTGQFTIFPNPAKEKIFLNLSAYEGSKAEIMIYNKLGQLMLSRTIGSLSGEAIQLDLAGLAGGIYLAKVTINDREQLVKEFVINLN